MNKSTLIAAILVAAASAVQAATIPLKNAGFEEPDLGGGGAKVQGFDVGGTDVVGWYDLGANADSGVQQGGNVPANTGVQAAFFRYGDAGAAQDTGYTIVGDEQFTVSFYASDVWQAGNLEITLVDSAANVLGTYTTPAIVGGNTLYEGVFNDPVAIAAAAGNDISIQIVHASGALNNSWAGVDDVTLNVSTNPIVNPPPVTVASTRPTTEPLTTVDLSGTWDFDPDNGAATTIHVPGGGWLKQGFTCTEADYETSITVTNIGQPQVTILEFGAVNYEAVLYVDGAVVSTNVQSYTCATWDISDYVTPGSTHAIRVHVKGRYAFMSGGKSLVPNAAGWSGDLPEGIFRSAELKIYPQVYLSDVFVKPSVANSDFYYDVTIRNESSSVTNVMLSGTLDSWNGDAWSYPAMPATNVALAAGAETNLTVGPISWTLGPDSYWWPNVPYQEGYQAKLHYLNLSLAPAGEGAVIHTNSTRFGFRECTQGPDGLGNTCYFLNGIRVNFRGDNLQGADYDNIVHNGGRSDAYDMLPGFLPPSEGNPGWPGAVDNYQRLNYNVNRIHQQPCTPYMLDVCDEMGLMIIEETAIRGSANDQDFINGHDNMVDHLKELFTRDRNHASIVRQSLSNEPDQSSTDSVAFAFDLYNAAMEVDGTRPLSIDPGATGQAYDAITNSNFSAYRHYVGPANTNVGYHFAQYTDEVLARPDRPYGQGEYIWWADSTKQGLAWFGTSCQAMRAKGASDIRPYTLLSAWASIIPGVNRTDMIIEQGGNPVFGEDNLPDPWSNPIIQRVQAGFNPVLVADADYWDEVKLSNSNGDWPAYVPVLGPTQTVTRTLNIFNDTFSGTDVDVFWELRIGSPTGTIADWGVVNATVQPGYVANEDISFTMPYVTDGTSLYLILWSEKDGEEMFREEAQRFLFSNTELTGLSGSAFGTGPAWAPGREFDKATDGDPSTYFDYNEDLTGLAGYTGIDLGAGNESIISYIVFTPRSGFEDRMIGGEFQGSNTSTNAGYTTIYTNSVEPTGRTTVPVNTDTAYRYLRYVGPAGSYCNIAEMEFYHADAFTAAEVWRLLNFGTVENSGDAADGADPDDDGVFNVFERAGGGDPWIVDADLLPGIDPAAPLLSIDYRKAIGAADLALEVQECSDLVSNSWTTAVGTNTVLSDDGIIQSNRFTVPVGAEDAKFLRLRLHP